jgi:hypothetical protein
MVKIGKQVAFLVPLVCNFVIDANNLWTNTQIADSTSEREDSFRAVLNEHLGYQKPTKKKRILYKCMASGEAGNSDEIQGAHIVPAKSKLKHIFSIGMNQEDVNSV